MKTTRRGFFGLIAGAAAAAVVAPRVAAARPNPATDLCVDALHSMRVAMASHSTYMRVALGEHVNIGDLVTIDPNGFAERLHVGQIPIGVVASVDWPHAIVMTTKG